jgi:hypothetical protein
MPIVANVQITAAKNDAAWVLFERVIVLSLFIFPKVGGSVCVTLGYKKRIA